MKFTAPRKFSKQVLDDACDWFVELNTGQSTSGLREGFDAWLRISPEHVRAYLQVAADWEEYAPRGSRTSEDVEALVEFARVDRNVIALQPQPAMSRGVSSRRGFKWAALAASVLVAGMVSVFVRNQHNHDDYSTDVGEQRTLRLEDGSTVELNSKSRIRVRYGSERRLIELVSGQALFRVRKEAARPFIVDSGIAHIRAIGTQFDVYRRSTGTTVTVLEGRVQVSRGTQNSKASQSAATLVAGQQVIATPKVVSRPKPADLSLATAWTQHRLVFSKTRLAEVVEEFNRYNPIPLVVSDPVLNEMQISGSFSSSEPASLLLFLQEVGSYSVRETPEAVYISRP